MTPRYDKEKSDAAGRSICSMIFKGVDACIAIRMDQLKWDALSVFRVLSALLNPKTEG
jgi:hypothetical protein